MLNPRCPSCDSRWVGFLVPPLTLAVYVPQDSGTVALANTLGRYVSRDDLDHSKAVCLDCGVTFNAEEKR